MTPVVFKTDVKSEELTLKKGHVGKLTTEARRRVPDNILVNNKVKKNYYVNKAK